VTLSTAEIEALVPPLVLEVCLNGEVLGEVDIPRAIRLGDHFHMEIVRPGGDFVEIAQMKIEGCDES
jgi:D-aminopeptidase